MIVTFLKLAVDLDVLDVERCEVLEDLIGLPIRDVGLTLLILFFRQMLDLDLLLKVVHGIG